MQSKLVTAEEAVALIGDGDTLCTSGFVGIGVPEALLATLEQRYLESGKPEGLTLLFAAGQGDGNERGLNRLGHQGLLKRVIGGHWGLIPKVAKLATSNLIEAYNLPQGIITHLYRDIAAGKPGTLSRVGLRTFVDPRLAGGRINKITREEIVRLMEIDGEEFLFYRALPINAAFLRGTTADPEGNLSMERECLILDNLAMAMAARNSGGLVIAQVERVADSGSLNPRMVQVPSALVDCVVVAPPELHPQTYATQYSPAYSGELRVPLDSLAPLPLNDRKIIARRAAFEVPLNGVINLGIGMPEGVASVANEEKILRHITLTTEPGVIGGVPASGLDFGAAVNTSAIIHQNSQFDFYDGGGLDLACLGMAQCDAQGNVNVSRFGPRLAGAGGFINISQNARRLVFAGTFTAGGLQIAVDEGRLRIVSEGRSKKFLRQVEEVTFSGGHAAKQKQPVLYVTERCVFRRVAEGMALIEIAPGVDLERDVLAQMEFEPIIDEPAIMDPRIFLPDVMELEQTLLDIGFQQRLSYDSGRNVLFLNFEGLQVRSADDVQKVRAAVERRCREIGQLVRVVVNYDGCRIEDGVLDAWAEMARYMEENFYSRVTRYTTSAFMRMKLGDALSNREVAPHIFESREDADWCAGGAELET